ncbi:MAG: MFS transporter, partial [Verrucomicrobia bacterium]
MIKERALWPLVPIILKSFDAPGMITGIFMGTLSAALGLVLGPIVSYRSDRLRSTRGRHIPYLLLSTPFAAAGIIGCAFSA